MKSTKEILSKLMEYVLPLALLLIFSVLLFPPQLEGKLIVASDAVSSEARTLHLREYRDEVGHISYWNPTEFAGDPIFLLHLGEDDNLLRFSSDLFSLKVPRPIGLFFMIGSIMFVSLCFLGLNPWLSLGVSIIYILSTNYFVLLEAGHAKKILTVAYFPFIVSGIVLAFREKYLPGFLLILLGTSLAIFHGHVQMVLYLLIALVFFVLPFTLVKLREHKFKAFGLALVVMITGAIIGALTNYAQLYSSQKFSESTMRGKPVLVTANENNSSSSVDGLDWKYAMNWSFEVQDFVATFIPRAVGGASGEPVEKDNPLAQLMIQNGAKPDALGKITVPGYWSTMPFTTGPPYLGASILFFFLFSIIAFRKPIYWASALAFFSIFLLSLGENASWFNKLLFDYLPLFNKFRAPSSVIVIAPVFIGISAALGLQELYNSENRKSYLKSLYISAGVMVGFGLFIILFGGTLFSFISEGELQYPANIQDTLVNARKAMQSADAWRSIYFVLACSAALLLFIFEKVKFKLFLPVALSLIFIIDALPIDRRYVNKTDFISEAAYEQQFAPNLIDQQIAQLEPKGRGYYRVLDMSVNTFNSSIPCLYHNQIGGYNPAKLQRYQDLIDYHIGKNNMEVLNMLNTKYFVSQKSELQTNPNANGNAWFVKEIKSVSTAEEEINALNGFKSKNTAIVNTSDFPQSLAIGDGLGQIDLVDYAPDKLVYKSNSLSKQVAVFSEVWYGGNPDWTVSIDGNPSEFIRCNYILRAMEIPAGEHLIQFEFRPEPKGYLVSLVFSGLSVLLIILGIGYGLKLYFSNKAKA